MLPRFHSLMVMLDIGHRTWLLSYGITIKIAYKTTFRSSFNCPELTGSRTLTLLQPGLGATLAVRYTRDIRQHTHVATENISCQQSSPLTTSGHSGHPLVPYRQRHRDTQQLPTDSLSPLHPCLYSCTVAPLQTGPLN